MDNVSAFGLLEDCQADAYIDEPDLQPFFDRFGYIGDTGPSILHLNEKNHQKAIEHNIPRRTLKCMLFSLRKFYNWRQLHNSSCYDKKEIDNMLPCNDLLQMSDDLMFKQVSQFFNEARRDNGDPLAVSTLKVLRDMIQKYLNECGRNLRLSANSSVSQAFRSAMERSVSFANSKPPKPSAEQDANEVTWTEKDLGWDNPEQLWRTLVWLIGKNFNLYTSAAHRLLRFQHFTLETTAEGDVLELRLPEDLQSGSIGEVKRRLQKDDNFTDVVAVFKRYLEVLPDESIGKPSKKWIPNSCFYLLPLPTFTDGCWFKRQAMGKVTLQPMIKELNAQLVGNSVASKTTKLKSIKNTTVDNRKRSIEDNFLGDKSPLKKFVDMPQEPDDGILNLSMKPLVPTGADTNFGQQGVVEMILRGDTETNDQSNNCGHRKDVVGLVSLIKNALFNKQSLKISLEIT